MNRALQLIICLNLILSAFVSYAASDEPTTEEARATLFTHILEGAKSVEELKAILDKARDDGLEYSTSEEDGDSCMHMAARSRSNYISLFIERGHIANIINEDLQTPLHIAALAGSFDNFKMLYPFFPEALQMRDIGGQTPLELAQERRSRSTTHYEEICSYCEALSQNTSQSSTQDQPKAHIQTYTCPKQ